MVSTIFTYLNNCLIYLFKEKRDKKSQITIHFTELCLMSCSISLKYCVKELERAKSTLSTLKPTLKSTLF